jgi:hypothetical protein
MPYNATDLCRAGGALQEQYHTWGVTWNTSQKATLHAACEMYRPPPHFECQCLLPRQAKIPIILIIFSQSFILEAARDPSSGNLFPSLLVPPVLCG